MTAESWVLRAFPSNLRAEAVHLADALPHASLNPRGRFDVDVTGERISIPYRIYQDGLPRQHENWSATQRLVADCLYTRHHDGRVRERHARLIVADTSPWVVPFVVHLIGEYVLEIVLAIEERLAHISTADSAQRRAYGTFASANPRFLRLTMARVASYWNCYYRQQFPSLLEYPPRRLIMAIEQAAQGATPATAGKS